MHLRPITLNDTANIVRWRNSPSVLRFFLQRDPITAETHKKWIETMVDTGRVAQFIIVDDGGRDVGSTYLRDIDRHNRKAEFGIFIGEDSARGQGLGTAACREILRHGFLELGLHRIMLRVLSTNAAAIRSYCKVGFREEGVLRDDAYFDGGFHDVLLMSVLEGECVL